MAEKGIVKCALCDTEQDEMLIDIGLAFGFLGDDYSFCRQCLQSMTAEQFLFKMMGVAGGKK